jgi:hypothetical protein
MTQRREPPRPGRIPRGAVLGIVFTALVLALITYAMMGVTRHSCEVCIEFGGGTACRTAEGKTRDEALRTATDNACAQLTSGMTNTIACTNTPPKSTACN